MIRSDNKNIICIKWGDKYGCEYVNRLYGMVSRNISPPFRFYCFTDNASGIRAEVICRALPELGCKAPQGVPGQWRKIALWGDLSGQDGQGPKGQALFVDLDTVIVDNIDPLFTYGNEKDVIVARNWLKPFHRLGQTTLFRYYIGAQTYIHEDFIEDPQRIGERYRYEQHYVTRHVKSGVKFWPRQWVRHYRVHCLGNYLKRYIRPARLPGGVKVVAFPGEPNPRDALVGQWTGGHPVTALQHLRNTFSADRRLSGSIIKHLKSFQLPCSWVRDHWKE